MSSQETRERVHLRRSIVIGMGGTGRTVCTHLKRILLERNDFQEDRFPHVQILSIDTDNRLKAIEHEPTGTLTLSADETLGLLLPDRDPSAYRRFIGKKSLDLLPDANDQGAMAQRPLGHAFLVTNWRRIREAIIRCFRRLDHSDLFPHGAHDPGLRHVELDGDRLDLYVVGNLVSGTGSGTAVGMGYLLRTIQEELKASMLKPQTEGIFTTCGAYNLGDVVGEPSPYAVNCYAALLELAHYSDERVHKNDRRVWDPGFDDVDARGLNRPPYDRVQLLNPTHAANGALTHEELEPRIAEVLALRTGSLIGMEANAKFFEEVKGAADRDKFGNRQFCWAWGARTFRSAGQRILDLAAYRTAARVADALVRGLGASTLDRAATATDFAESLGLGYSPQDEPGSRRAALLLALLTPPEPVQGIPSSSNLLDALHNLVDRSIPAVEDDRETIRGLPEQMRVARGRLEERYRSLLGELVAGNRRRLAAERWESARRQIEDLADASRHSRGSLDDAVAVLDLLLGNGEEPGSLRAESEIYQAQVAATASDRNRGSRDAEQAAHGIQEISRMGRGWTLDALRGARNQLVEGLVRQYAAEAKQKAYEEARTILDGDAADKEETFRLGLIRLLEQLRGRLRASRQGLETVEGRLTAQVERLSRSLEGSAAAPRETASRLSDEALDGEGLRSFVADAVERFGPPAYLDARFRKPNQARADASALERMVRPRIEELGSTLRTESIETDPDFGGRLDEYLREAEPAIRLDADATSGEQIALVSIPDDVPSLRDRLLQDEQRWIERRKGQKEPEERIQSRAEDHEPRVDVITTCHLFSPAAIAGVDEWNSRYERAVSTETGMKNVHTVPPPRRGRLVFEPLGTTESRLLVAYFVGRALGWLREEDGEAVYTFEVEGALEDYDEARDLGVPFDRSDLLVELRKPLRPGNVDPEYRLPIFLHLLRRLDAVLADDGPERDSVIEALASELASRLSDGDDSGGGLLPSRRESSTRFAGFVNALQVALEPLDAFEPVRQRARALRDGGAPAKVAAASGAARCPNGHDNPPGSQFCATCGQRIEAHAPGAEACRVCGTPALRESRFCGHCGELLASSAIPA